MVKTFANKLTETVANGKTPKRLPNEIVKRALMRLVQIDNAVELKDLQLPYSNNLEPLVGERKGQHSIRINRQWRVCFRFESGNAFNVEITDYH